jgi:putative ABC transport system substrate-binding protein
VNRRAFINLLGGAAAVVALPVPRLARAQPAERMRRVSAIIAVEESDPQAEARATVLRRALADLGWTDGGNIRIDFRFTGADPGRIAAAARELIALGPELGPDVILANTTPVVAALQRERTAIPIVFNQVSDPVAMGFIASLERPGGTTTGFTNIFEPGMGGRWLGLIKEIAPRTRRAALIYNPATNPASYLRSAQAAAPGLGIAMHEIKLRDAGGLKDALAAFAAEGDGALLVQPDVTTTANRALIMAAAATHRLPAIYPYNYYPAEGGLMSYGIDLADGFRRAASYVDRILRGARAGELPVEQPRRFALAINLKTAKALGLDVPPVLIARADEVIE